MTSPIEQEAASAILRAQLTEWGLSELYGDVDQLIKDGLGQDAVTLRLQQTDAYRKRFVANEARTKNGLAVLTPAEYIAAENAYRRVMQTYGLPQGFWDQPSDFSDFIGRDVSPDEVNQRAQVAQQIWLTSDAGVRAAWQDFYGLTDGAAIAQILDPQTAEPIVQRMATAAQIGALARASGLQADRARFETLAEQGFTADSVRQAFGEIGQTLRTEQGIAARFGQTFTQAEAEGARVTGAASALRKQRQLEGSEQALFDAKAAVDAKSLNKSTQGRF